VRVAAGGTESHPLYTTHDDDDDDDGGGGKYIHDTDTAILLIILRVVGCLARSLFHGTHGGAGVTRFTYTRHDLRSSTHTPNTRASTSTTPSTTESS